MNSKVVSASEIPSLDILYATWEIDPATPKIYPSQPINSRVSVWRGDITRLSLDAIVNAANNSLLGGGGVDGAIHKAAGPSLRVACAALKGCQTGEAKITKGYHLPAKHIIHTVGPVYSSDFVEDSEALLRSCYEKSLHVAVQNDVRTIAFSGISTGVYGYPSNAAAMVACETVRNFLEGEDGTKLDKVVFVTFLEKDVMAYRQAVPQWFPNAEKA